MTPCRICLDERVSEIDQLLQQGRPISLMVKEWQYPRNTLAKHRAHSILQSGTFDRQVAGSHHLVDLGKRLISGYAAAMRWKDPRLYADCLRAHTQLVQLLLEPAKPQEPVEKPLPAYLRLPKLNPREVAKVILQTVPEASEPPQE